MGAISRELGKVVARRPDQRRGERGAIVPMVAMLLAVLIPAAAMAVDLGMQRVVRRDMQVVADNTARNLASMMKGRTAAEIEADPAWAAAIAESVAGNQALGDVPDMTVEVGYYTVGTNGVTFTKVTGSAIPRAVRVQAQGAVDFAFADGRGGATRSAIAIPAWGTDCPAGSPDCSPCPPGSVNCPNTCTTGQCPVFEPASCFSIGSYAARVRQEMAASVTGSVSSTARIGNTAATFQQLTSINTGFTNGLDVLSYQGLADATVNLADVAAELGAGSPAELASTSVSYGEYFLAIANVLADNGNATDAAVLNTLASRFGSSGNVLVGNLLALDQGARGMDGNINVYDRVVGAAYLMNGNSFLTIPGVSAATPSGLAAVSSQMQLIQAAQTACARPMADPAVYARTSQLSATVQSSMSSRPVTGIAGLVSAVTLNSVSVASTAGSTIQTSINLASARAQLTDYRCASTDDPSYGYGLETTSGLLTSVTTVPVTITAQIGTPPLSLTTANIRVVYTVTATPSGAAVSNVEITVPPEFYDTAYGTGSGDFPLPGVTTTSSITGTTYTGLGAALFTATALNQIVSSVGSLTITPLVNQLNTNITAPLADALGLQVGGADVMVHQHVKDTCNTAIVIG